MKTLTMSNPGFYVVVNVVIKSYISLLIFAILGVITSLSLYQEFPYSLRTKDLYVLLAVNNSASQESTDICYRDSILKSQITKYSL